MASRDPGTGSDPDSFGKYRFIAALGQGGMAAVHLAVVHGPGGFNKLVVLKQVHPQYCDDPEILGMFRDEARLAARMSHANVVQAYEVGNEGDRHYLAMEYLDGQPLNRILQRSSLKGGLPLVVHLQILSDMLAGLHYAHELADYDGTPLGVVHRDVTPQNVFVTYDGAVKVLDFGIAKTCDATTHTRVGIIKGKLAYMAPEQARGGDLIDRRADVFAAGVMLWEAATGTRPWKSAVELTLLNTLLAGDFPTPRSVTPGVPEALEAIILKATSLHPGDRYATAAELQSAIDGYIDSVGGRVSQRELGQVCAAYFEADRAVIKALIVEQLRRADGAGANATRLPVIDHLTPSNSDSARHRRSATTLCSEPPRADRGEASDPPVVAPADLAAFAAQRPTTSPRWRSFLIAVGGVVLAAAATMAAVGLSYKTSPTTAQAASLPAVEAHALPSAEVVEPVELRVSASPPQAEIYLDEERLAGNPIRARLGRDMGLHQIRVEAPGFAPRTESVTLDKDLIVDIVLVGDPAAPPEWRGVARQTRSPKLRYLDPRNPYLGH